MALTRARVVAGDAGLAEEVAKAVREILLRKRDPERIAYEVRKMRALIAHEKGDRDPWDLKLVKGGLMDIEFRRAAPEPGLRPYATGHPRRLDPQGDRRSRRAPASSRPTRSRPSSKPTAYYTDATQFMRLRHRRAVQTRRRRPPPASSAASPPRPAFRNSRPLWRRWTIREGACATCTRRSSTYDLALGELHQAVYRRI